MPLLVLNLILLSMQIEDPRGTLVFKRWVLVAEAPFLIVSSGIWGGLEYLWTNYFWLHGARNENRQLQAKVRDLTLQLENLQQAQKENERLQGLLGLSDSLVYRTITAKVVGRTPDFMSKTIYIDHGSEAGIAPDNPVLSSSGVVGRVVFVTRYHSQIQLISNADASTGVMVERTRSPGVLKGSGDSMLNLDYISNTEQINAGDLLISSGLDGIYPKGLPVGKVAESHKGNSVFRSIKVEPAADLVHIEEVLVLIASKPGPNALIPGK